MSSELDLILNLASNLGAIGLVFYLVLRTTNKTIPRLAQTFEDNLKHQRKDFKESNDQARDDFMSMIKEQREFFKEQVEREREISQLQTTKIVDALKELKTEIRNSGVV